MWRYSSWTTHLMFHGTISGLKKNFRKTKRKRETGLFIEVSQVNLWFILIHFSSEINRTVNKRTRNEPIHFLSHRLRQDLSTYVLGPVVDKYRSEFIRRRFHRRKGSPSGVDRPLPVRERRSTTDVKMSGQIPSTNPSFSNSMERTKVSNIGFQFHGRDEY